MDNPAPTGTIPASSTPVQTEGALGGAPGGGNSGGNLPGVVSGGAPTGPISLSDDSLITMEGFKEPVKFGEHVRGLKSQLTKATQARSAIEKERDQLRQAMAQHEQRQRQSGQSNPQNDVFAALEQLPYVAGKDLVEVTKTIHSAITQRDQALIVFAKELSALKQQVGGVTAKTGEAEFTQKMGKFREQLGLSEEWGDWLTELYLAYEGDDLDEEFPGIAQKRIDQIQNAIRKQDKMKVEAAKRAPFIPGKGGQGTPSRPLDKMKTASAREIADHVWDSLGDDGA